jgi:acetate kinase
MARQIGVINAGSSSIKFAIFNDDTDQSLLFRGQMEKIGVGPSLTVEGPAGEKLIEKEWGATDLNHHSATKIILESSIALLGGEGIEGIGHRVVHGGMEFAAPTVVTKEVVASLKSLCPLAPLHQPHNLTPIESILAEAPHIPQVACFDTAFHQTQPLLAQSFALPRDLTEAGVRRYGFHGLSYEYVSGKLRDIAPEQADGRIIVAHLGNGASLCAMHQGQSVATTMGFTAVEGLMMGTRCGSIDPGVLLYLMDERGMDARALEDLVYKKSGLLGVSGLSSDMRTLRASDDPRAREAIDLFIYRIVREIGSLAAALGGLDGIIFTGGIGQRDARTRKEVIDGCGWLGAAIDEQSNAAGEGRIDGPSSKIPVWVLPTDEERVIARHTAALLEPSGEQGGNTGVARIRLSLAAESRKSAAPAPACRSSSRARQLTHPPDAEVGRLAGFDRADFMGEAEGSGGVDGHAGERFLRGQAEQGAGHVHHQLRVQAAARCRGCSRWRWRSPRPRRAAGRPAASSFPEAHNKRRGAAPRPSRPRPSPARRARRDARDGRPTAPCSWRRARRRSGC